MNDRVYRSYDGIIDQYIEHIRVAEQECEELRAENAALREALEPFALLADECDDYVPKGLSYTNISMRISELRRARAALARPSTAGKKGDQHAKVS